jgi:hypothetical protein
MPTTDEDGMPIRTAIASRPNMLSARAPFGRHALFGANAYMLRLLAAEREWVGTATPTAALEAAAAATERFAQRAATLTIESAMIEGGSLRVTVRVQNETGHRFPTGYPSRRAWVELRVLDQGGAVRWASGRFDRVGALVDASGRRVDLSLDAQPHRQVIRNEDEVQIYEGVMADQRGAPTHVLLRAWRWLKDNRIPPRGFSTSHPAATLTQIVGVEGDPDFGQQGSDVITYQFSPSGFVPARVEATLWYQSVTPLAIESFSAHPTPESERFVSMTQVRPPTPLRIASPSISVR